MPLQFKCPECDASLKLANEALAGKKIKCPKCTEVIKVPAAKAPPPEELDEDLEEEETPPPAKKKIARDEVEDDAPPPRSKRNSRPEPEEDEEEDERPRRKKKAKPAPSFLSQYGLYLGIGGAAVAAIVVVVVILVLPGGDGNGKKGPIGQNQDKNPPFNKNANPPDGEQPLKLTAKALSKDYQDDRKAADQKYKDKTIILTGEIFTIGIDLGGETRVGLEGATVGTPILCLIQVAFQDKALRLTKGQKLTIKGQVFGYQGFPLIQECELLETGPDPAIYLTAAELTKDFINNQAEASKKYDGKELGIEGFVVEVKKMDSSHYLILQGFNEKIADPIRVSALVPFLQIEQFKGLRAGQKVLIKGACIGKLGNEVMIGNCLLVDQGK